MVAGKNVVYDLSLAPTKIIVAKDPLQYFLWAGARLWRLRIWFGQIEYNLELGLI